MNYSVLHSFGEEAGDGELFVVLERRFYSFPSQFDPVEVHSA